MIKMSLRVVLGLLASMGLWAGSADAAATSTSYFSAVIDAGSSGSRIYLYQVTSKGKSVRVDDLFGDEPLAVPGLSDFKDHPVDAFEGGVKPLLNSLETYLGQKGIDPANVRFHVLATGGLRQLDPLRSNAILTSVRKGLEATAYPVGQVRILPAEMEGVLAWADFNALDDRLGSGKPTSGIVEIGGVSAQVAFEAKPAQIESKIWHIAGRSYRIFSQSYLGLGQNAARKSMIHTQDGGTLQNACYPAGVSVTDKKTSVENLTGGFDFDRCVSLYREVIRQTPNFESGLLAHSEKMTFAGIGQGNPVGPIKGSISLWKRSGDDPKGSLAEAQKACKMPWAEFSALFGAELVNQNQCANTLFIETFLYDPMGLGIHRIHHVEAIEGRVPSWTRGLFLVQDVETN